MINSLLPWSAGQKTLSGNGQCSFLFEISTGVTVVVSSRHLEFCLCLVSPRSFLEQACWVQWIDEPLQLCMCAFLHKELSQHACTFVSMQISFCIHSASCSWVSVVDIWLHTCSHPACAKALLRSSPTLHHVDSPQLRMHCPDPAWHPRRVGKAKPTGFSRPTALLPCVSVLILSQTLSVFLTFFPFWLQFLSHLVSLWLGLTLWLFFSLAHQTHCIITSFSTTSWCSGLTRAVRWGHLVSLLCFLVFLPSCSTFLDSICTTF